MTDMTLSPAPARIASRNWGRIALRWILFTLLGLFALFYLMPLFVMVTT
jgi:glucose/mannose transport system permease protein